MRLNYIPRFVWLRKLKKQTKSAILCGKTLRICHAGTVSNKFKIPIQLTGGIEIALTQSKVTVALSQHGSHPASINQNKGITWVEIVILTENMKVNRFHSEDFVFASISVSIAKYTERFR